MKRSIVIFVVAIFSQAFCSYAQAEQIKVLSWNVESDRPDIDTNDTAVIAYQLGDLQSDRGTL